MAVVRGLFSGVLRSQNCMLKLGYSTKSPGLLNDVNVLDLTRVVAGPVCTMTMGDLGANVIKVESLDGDEARRWGPPFINENKDSLYFLSVNRNKKSVCVDFKSPEGNLKVNGRPKKRWLECVWHNMAERKVTEELTSDREKWRKLTSCTDPT